MYKESDYQEGVKRKGKGGLNGEIKAININCLNFSIKTQ